MKEANPLPWWRRPPWRVVLPATLFLLTGYVAWCLWSPGLDVRDGRHNRGRNGIWIAHGWLGGDEWFTQNGKTDQIPRYRNKAQVGELIERLQQQGITDIFPHLCPTKYGGALPPVDDASTERFLDLAEGLRVMPWIGGPGDSPARYRDAQWRTHFAASIHQLFAAHQRLAGVQINIEPLRSGDPDFLTLLELVRPAIPPGKLLSVAAYPPPTRWHPFPEVHWEEGYFREVALRCDQLAVMTYDSGLHQPKLYERLMADWTCEILAWSEGRSVLLGVPTYRDADSGYHDPAAENLVHALRGIHAGLARGPLPSNYQGVALYCDWETDAEMWREFHERFVQKADR